MDGSSRQPSRMFVVGDIGLHHQGDFDRAVRWVNAVARCGVDAVRFPVFQSEGLADSRKGPGYGWLKQREFRRYQLAKLADLSHELGLAFLVSPRDFESAQAVLDWVDGWYLESVVLDDGPLIELVCETGKRCLAMCEPESASEDESQVMARHAWVHGSSHVTLVHSNSLQGDRLGCDSDCHAMAADEMVCELLKLQTRWRGPVGWDDRQPGTQGCVLAVAAGADVICKSIGLDCDQSSAEPEVVDCEQMQPLVERLREIHGLRVGQESLGRAAVTTASSRLARWPYAVRDLDRGHIVVASDIAWVTQAVSGVVPELRTLLGLRLETAMRAGEAFGRVSDQRRAA